VPRICTLCSHPDRAEIDRLIASGGGIRTIADRFGLSHQCVLRHRDGHLAAAVVEHEQVRREAQALDVFGRLVELDATLRDALALARRLSDVRGIAAVAGREIDLLALWAKLQADQLPVEAVRQLAAAEGLDESDILAAAEQVLRAGRL
jgi:hypothetical protein